jgi:diadenosine tetraphosphate (Ap4A) HIT family hydrolase
MECAFCNNPDIDARVIIDTGLARAFPTFTPVVVGHMLIVPKRHVQRYDELTSEEKDAVEGLRMKLHGAMQKAFGAEGFNYAWNEARVAGQSVPHFHLHMLPRKEGDAGIYEYEPRGFLYATTDDENPPTQTPAQELQRIATLIRETL